MENTDSTLSWACDQPDAVALATRNIALRCFEDGSDLEVVGRLTDTREASASLGGDGVIHDMELRLKVETAAFTITAVRATMFRSPHDDCSDIEGAFEQLVGLSVVRGYNRRVQELLGRERGCSHLEFLARAIGPVVTQGATAHRTRDRLESDTPPESLLGSWLTNTCHIHAEGGPAQVKLSLGWKPGAESPVPRVEVFRARAAEAAESEG